MTWHRYQLAFRLRTPLHAGYQKIGYLQRTRRYVPARTMRGAAIARLAALLGVTGDTSYQQLLREANDRIAFGYFFPALAASAPLRPSLCDGMPSYRTDGDNPQVLKAADFDRLFITSITSTALDDRRRSALDGSLHEVECLSPLTSTEEEPQTVYLTGALYVKDNAGAGHHLDLTTTDGQVRLRLPDSMCSLFEQVFDGMQAGGERKYGFGRLAYTSAKLDPPAVDLGDGPRPILHIPGNTPFDAHADAALCQQATGSLEPLLGRETREGSRFGQSLSKVSVCWVPGSYPHTDGDYLLRDDGTFARQNPAPDASG